MGWRGYLSIHAGWFSAALFDVVLQKNLMLFTSFLGAAIALLVLMYIISRSASKVFQERTPQIAGVNRKKSHLVAFCVGFAVYFFAFWAVLSLSRFIFRHCGLDPQSLWLGDAASGAA